MMNNKDSTITSPVPELVTIPVPGKGHLASILEFSKHLLRHHDKLSITILVIPPYHSDDRTNTSDHDRIKYDHPPRVDPPLAEFDFLNQVEIYKPHVKDAIKNVMSSRSTLLGVVIDMFCTSMIDVAKEFDVPTYLFFTTGAAVLGFFRSLPVHFRPDDDSESTVIVPSYVNPVPTSALPGFVFSEEVHLAFTALSKRFMECKGIFVNTFLELESHAVKSLLSSRGEFPPVYTVGPLLDLATLERKSTVHDDDDRANKIMRWLDDQLSSTVVLLCFGSVGSFQDPSQLKEIALGLERIGHRFLWSVRRSTSNSIENILPPDDYADYEKIIPEGFLERIGERGMVCGWVPQAEVLSHPAIGGFVSHCGWNSILESLWFGVPIAAWPMYAEQQLNAFFMVKELGLAIELNLGYNVVSGDLVMADDVKKVVTSLMVSDSDVRKRVKYMSEKSRKVITYGGSSYVSFQRLMKDMFQNISL